MAFRMRIDAIPRARNQTSSCVWIFCPRIFPSQVLLNINAIFLRARAPILAETDYGQVEHRGNLCLHQIYY